MQRKKQIRFVAVILFSFLFTITVSLQAQVPRTISFQGLLTNPDGSSLPDGAVSLEFMLYESETGGTAIWTETQSVNTKSSIFSAILGKVTPLTAAFDKPYWVGIKVNGNSELVPRIALTASPYSLGGSATVTEPGPGQNFQVKDSTGIATHIINSNGDTWSAGVGTFGNAIVVGDTTVVPDTSTTSIINTNKIKFGINRTLGILGADVGGRIGKGGIGVFGWSQNNKIAVFAMAQSGVGVLAKSQSGPAVQAFSTSGIGVDAQSTTQPAVRGFSINGAGVVGTSTNGLAGHFKSGNVRIENKLKIDVVPSTTETNYMVWSSDHFVKVNNTPIGGPFDGVLIDIPLIIKDGSNNTTVTHNPDGTTSQTGLGTFNGGIEVPIIGGGDFTIDANGNIDVNNSSNTSVWGVNPNGTTSQTGLGTFNGGWSVPLDNGNILRGGPDNGLSVRNTSGTFFAHIDPDGNALFAGNVAKGGGSFKIDHPLEPLNKYLSHSFVESPDMMNVYNGNINLDNNGEATVELPNWFESLNKDFRYQLTPVGAPGPNLYVSQEIEANTFKIAGGKAGMKVSWQITGIRQDAYANLNRIKVEEVKPIAERGKYLHPDAYKQSVVYEQK